MPLLPGKKNIGKNIETEEKAGKPKAQSLAIALNVSRRAKKMKMAKGGPVSAKTEDRPMPGEQHEDSTRAPSFKDADEHYASIADAILAKSRKAKMMAEGGQVDLSENAEEMPNNEDDLSFEALKKENYSESEGLDALDSPKDSNEKGRAMEDKHDESIVDAIRRKSKKSK